MKTENLLTNTFDIVRVESGGERFREKGINRILKIGFLSSYIFMNWLSQTVLGKAGNGFIIPTGLSTNRLVFLTFLLTLIYFQTSAEDLKTIDRKIGLNWFYVEERDKII